MLAKKSALNHINQVAETQYMIRHKVIFALKQMNITELPQVLNPTGSLNYYQLWTNSYGDRFFDMGTLIRLASVIEKGLKYYYMEKCSIKNLVELKSDPDYTMNIFQRLMPWTKQSAITLFKKKLNYDLTSNKSFLMMQEMMLNRHLYAHNTGLLNEEYIDNYKELTGVDIVATLDTSFNYPQEDTYYFEPLKKIGDYIESARGFFSELPE